ncbi:MAG: hypothetical protein WBM69_20925 [Desulfobacterales bacterium]
MKWEISGKGRNSAKYGYYMLLIVAAPDVRDHLSDREVSTALFLPANIGSMAGELPRAHDISGQWISITIQEYMQSSRNFNFREAVQFIEIIHTRPKVVICSKLDPKTVVGKPVIACQKANYHFLTENVI